METKEILTVIEDELQSIDVILKHIANPNNLGGPDGEQVGAILAESGVNKIDRIQTLIEQLKPT